MGSCCSTDEDKPHQGDPNERTHLLNNPVSDIHPVTSNQPCTGCSQQQKGDEQSALTRILQHTANNVIDVSAIDSTIIEQHEYMDRARQYNTRVSIVCSQAWRSNRGPWTPSGVANPQIILAAPPVSLADIELITSASEQMSKAVREVKVKHKEELVVAFGVP